MSATPALPRAAVPSAAGVRRFLAWWRDTLVGCLPAGWQQRLKPESVQVQLNDAGDAFTLVGDAATAAQVAMPLRGGAALAGAPPGARPVTLLLAPGHVIQRRLLLPAAAANNLRQVLGFELGRRTPFAADEVEYDGRVVSRDADAGSLDVALWMVPRARLQGWLDPLRAAGLYATRVDVALPGGGVAGVDLLPADAARPPPDAVSRRHRLLLLAIALLAVALLVVPPLRMRAAADALAVEVEQARSQANTARQALDALRTELGGVDQLLALRGARPTVVALLAELAERLPDGTWLDQVDLAQDRIIIQGESEAAGALVAVLESSPRFATAAFDSPVTTDPHSGKERFRIALRLASTGEAQ